MNSAISQLTRLGGLTTAEFLRNIWQQQPLLVRQALPWTLPLIEPDELAGLALEDEVDARLVIKDATGKHWSAEHGPFTEQRFAGLGAANWTLLVRHVDKLNPHIHALRQAFHFVPSWRFDDIMVSYATAGGGVGPHFDYFDVFLLQVQGERHWRLGQRCDHKTALRQNSDLRLLEDFHTEQEWTLGPGDLLYIPPGVAHWGEALSECLTYSIGFRAPSQSDILLDYSQELASRHLDDERYRDPSLHCQNHHAEINTSAKEEFRRILRSIVDDEEVFERWLGEYLTQNDLKLPSLDTVMTESMLKRDTPCRLSLATRCAFTQSDTTTRCYIDGHSWICSTQLAVLLSNFERLVFSHFEGCDAVMLLALAKLGVLSIYEEN